MGLDDFSRECMGIEVDTNLPAARVLRVLNRIVAWRGLSAKLRVDNGPKLFSVLLADWAEKNAVALEFIRPGKPTHNSYIERFNKNYREEVLDFNLFKSFTEMKGFRGNWLRQYSEVRLHESLADLSWQGSS